MDSPTKCNHPSTGSLSQMSHEGYSADTQAFSEALAKNLGNLTLNPSIQFSSLPPTHSSQQQGREETPDYVVEMSYGLVYRRRRGVRTMGSLRRDLKGLFPVWLTRRNEAIQNFKKNWSKRVFQCGCSYCRSQRGPSGIAENCDMKSF